MRRMQWLLLGVLAVIATAAACLWVFAGGLRGGQGPQASPTGTPAIPGSCTKQTAPRVVEEFFVKWNDRDVGGVTSLFSSDLSFHDNVAGSQAMLLGHEALRRYLADRFLLGDRFSNVAADIPENPSPARANPTVSFLRSVGGTTYRGNAKLVCGDGLLRDVVMSAQ